MCICFALCIFASEFYFSVSVKPRGLSVSGTVPCFGMAVVAAV